MDAKFTIISLFVIIFIIPLFLAIFFSFIRRDLVITFLQIIFFDRTNSLYSKKSNINFIDKFVFTPHPFYNWSLNPYYKNKKGELVHTEEGFRKTFNEDSIIDHLSNYKSNYKIICIGGSSTHCAEMDDYRDTWPSLLHDKLNKKHNSTVINFGVGAWSTIQSQIRCLTWFSKIKPNLLIFYQCKNDLTPLFNGSLIEKEILPDYQNIVTQYSEKFFVNMPKIFLFIPLLSLFYFVKFAYQNRVGLLNIYKPKAEQNPSGMKRLNNDFIDSIYFRHSTIIQMCKEINCKVLYIPEVVTEGVYRDLLNNEIYPNFKKKIQHKENVKVFDIDPLIPKSSEFFLDKMHFTKKGNEFFSEILSKKIIKSYFE